MCGCANVTTNYNGIPYLNTTAVNVTDETVDFTLGFRRIQPVGYLTIRISDAIPADATGTLPVRLTLNGTTRALTFFGGAPVTAADLTGTGVITVFNDRINGILQITSALAPAA